MSANADDGLADDLETICRRISDSGVLSSQELLTLRGRYGQTTAGEFVQSLLADGKLTAYQWQELREQRGRSLVLGNYVVLDKLGQGGMGMVLKAYHRRMRRTVALKVLAPQVANNGDMVRRFQREVEAAARLTHPNIVTAFDADTADGVVFLVMEYVPGRDLSSHIKANGPLSIDVAVDYVRQTACGLEYAHQNGVIHRDVKPGNLLLTEAGVVKILDMGLARLDGTTDNVDANLTTTGAVMGTVDYMSPEQALDTRRADARADIYSLGCTLFTLLTGRPVYPESTVMKRLLAHREAAIPRLSEHLPQPAATVGTRLGEVDAVLQRMLAKQPGERFQTMGDVMTALEAATRGVRLAQPVAARPPVIHAAKSGSASVTSALVQSATVANVNNAVAPTMTFGQNPHEGTLPSLAGLVTERIPYTRSHKPGFKQSKPWFILLGLASLCLIALGLAVFMTPPALPSTATSKASQTTALNSTPVVPPLLLDSAHWPRGPGDTQWQGILPQPMPISGIRRWQVETVSGRSRIAHLAWNPQGTRIAVASHDKRLRIYRWEQQRLELEQIVPDAELTYWTRGGIHWSPDGRWLAWLPPYGESVRSWDVEQQRFGPTVFASINSSFSGWNGDGTVLAIAGQATSGSGILLWEWPSGRLMRTMLSEGLDPPRTVHWSPDFQYLATGVGDGATRIWHLDGTPGAVIPIRASQIRWHPTQPLLAVLGRDDAHPSRQFAATVSLDGTIQKMIEERHPHGLGMSLEWSADGRFLISNLGGQNSQFEAYDLNGDFVQDLKYPVGQGWGIAHPLRPEFLLAEVGIQQINLETGESIAHLGRTPVGCPPVWTPDGRYLASASVPGLLDVWDVDRRLHVTCVWPVFMAGVSFRGTGGSRIFRSGGFGGWLRWC